MCSRWATWAAALAILLMIATMPLSCELQMFRGMATGCHHEMGSIALSPEHACCPQGAMPCCRESSPASAPVPLQSPTIELGSSSLTATQELVPIPGRDAMAPKISAELGVPPVLAQKEDFRT
jgi:hypothetical protein